VEVRLGGLLLERKYQADGVCVGWHPFVLLPAAYAKNNQEDIDRRQ
jgi:hypothetical protein